MSAPLPARNVPAPPVPGRGPGGWPAVIPQGKLIAHALQERRKSRPLEVRCGPAGTITSDHAGIESGFPGRIEDPGKPRNQLGQRGGAGARLRERRLFGLGIIGIPGQVGRTVQVGQRPLLIPTGAGRTRIAHGLPHVGREHHASGCRARLAAIRAIGLPIPVRNPTGLPEISRVIVDPR